jgi:CheY-like chemotaxis protein
MESIGTLAGGIAHDFNNILGVIIGYTELALKDVPPKSLLANKLDKVQEASSRAATMVKQILAFSRQSVIERVPLDAASLVKEAISFLRPSLPSTITIRQQIDTETKPIFADPTQVHQILINFCTNAFHAMELTGGTLEISLKDCEICQEDLLQHPGLRPGNFVELTISDTGCGIDPQIWGRIFDPYFTTKGVGKGTGMGLAIVHGIVKSYGGFITGASETGVGTVFRVYFPALEQEASLGVAPVQTIPLGNERILLIDDEEMLAELGKMMLASLGYTVTARTDSAEALAIFQHHPDQFDVVITDQTMPGLTGSDLAMKMLQIRPDLPIILCTGYSSIISKETAMAMGIKGFVPKPFTRQEIALLIRNVLEEGAASAANGS